MSVGIVTRKTTDWYKSYLSSKKFSFSVHDKFSTFADVQYGVPQGFILEPLLFRRGFRVSQVSRDD